MSLKLNDNIESVKHGTDEIGKMYVGEDLVFEHDKPVWFTRIYKAIKYSLDGVNYDTLVSYSSGNSGTETCYADGKFFVGSEYSTVLTAYKTFDVAKGLTTSTSFIPGVTSGISALASNR